MKIHEKTKRTIQIGRRGDRRGEKIVEIEGEVREREREGPREYIK